MTIETSEALTDDQIEGVQSTIASEAGVPVENVEVSVMTIDGGGQRYTATVTIPEGTEAEDVQETLTTSMGTIADAEATLGLASGMLTSEPSFVVVDADVDDDEWWTSTAFLASVGGGGALVLCLLLLACAAVSKKYHVRNKAEAPPNRGGLKAGSMIEGGKGGTTTKGPNAGLQFWSDRDSKGPNQGQGSQVHMNFNGQSGGGYVSGKI